MGCDLIVYPEAALTAFFPHWWIEDEDELDAISSARCRTPRCSRCSMRRGGAASAFILGTPNWRSRTAASGGSIPSILVGKDGRMSGNTGKSICPAIRNANRGTPFENLEKRYFEVGNLGFPVWHAFGGRVGMMICNDRRWPESYRVMGLQGVELIMLGYNTPVHNPAMPETDDLGNFHNRLVDAGGRLSERHLRRRRRQGGRGGGGGSDRSVLHHRAVRRGDGAMHDARRRVAGGALRSRPVQRLQRQHFQFCQTPAAGTLPADRGTNRRGGGARRHDEFFHRPSRRRYRRTAPPAHWPGACGGRRRKGRAWWRSAARA